MTTEPPSGDGRGSVARPTSEHGDETAASRPTSRERTTWTRVPGSARHEGLDEHADEGDPNDDEHRQRARA